MNRDEEVEAVIDRAVPDTSITSIHGPGVTDVFLRHHDGREVHMNLDAVLTLAAGKHNMACFRWSLAEGLENLSQDDPQSGRAPRVNPDDHPSDQLGQLVESLRTMERPALVVLHSGHAVVPAGPHEFTQLPFARIAEQLREFIEGSTLKQRGHRLVIVSEFGEPNQAFSAAPGIVRHRIGMPSSDEIAGSVKAMLDSSDRPLHLHESLTPESFAMLARGMTLRSLQSLRARATADQPLTMQMLQDAKTEVLEQVLGDIAVIEHAPLHLDKDVAGLPQVRQYVKRIKRRFARRKAMHFLLLLSGAPGVGKSLIATAIGYELGLVVIHLRLPKSKWYSESEQRLETFFEIAEVMAPVLVVFDEVDQNGMGRRSGSTGSDGAATDAALAGMLMKRLGDVGEKTGVCFVAMTNRPDRLDDAFMSRFDQLAVLYPSPDERPAIAEINARRSGVPLEPEAAKALNATSAPLSGRDIVTLIKNADDLAAIAGRDAVSAEDFAAALDATTVSIRASEQLQTLLALESVSFRPDLPWNAAVAEGLPFNVPEYFDLQALVDRTGALDRDELAARIQRLKAEVGND